MLLWKKRLNHINWDKYIPIREYIKRKNKSPRIAVEPFRASADIQPRIIHREDAKSAKKKLRNQGLRSINGVM